MVSSDYFKNILQDVLKLEPLSQLRARASRWLLVVN